MRLDGAVALVTGSSKGVGRAIALTLAQQGVRVVMNDHDRETHAQTIRFTSGQGCSDCRMSFRLFSVGTPSPVAASVSDGAIVSP